MHDFAKTRMIQKVGITDTLHLQAWRRNWFQRKRKMTMLTPAAGCEMFHPA
jgi:hypothetical protein